MSKPKGMKWKSIPFQWIKTWYSKGSGYESPPHDGQGNDISDEFEVVVKGSELSAFLASQRKEILEEVKEILDIKVTHINLDEDATYTVENVQKIVNYIANTVRDKQLNRLAELRNKLLELRK